MAATIVIEDECGTFDGTVHTHNGYYAGDFSATAWSAGDPVASW
jgi:hypothetical protein